MIEGSARDQSLRGSFRELARRRNEKLDNRKRRKGREKREGGKSARVRRWKTGNDAKCPDPLWLPLLGTRLPLIGPTAYHCKDLRI